MIRRLAALILIYLATVAAWMILGSTVVFRTHQQDQKLKDAVGQLWGTVQVQQAPAVFYETKRENETKRVDAGKTTSEIQTEIVPNYVPLKGSTIDTSLSLQHRQKGLLWYSTYTVRFSALYTVSNPTAEPKDLYFAFTFPSEGAVYDDFHFAVGGKDVENIQVASGTIRQPLRLAPGMTTNVVISYRSQGLDEWGYDFGANVCQVRDFQLSLKTDFARIDFPQNSISPSFSTRTKSGWNLKWEYANLLTGVKIGLALPRKLNPGPWVSDVTFSAPISLFLFFFVLFITSILQSIRLHPMHYFFIGAAYFSFHLLLAYLVDHVSIHLAFLICSAMSIFLVVSYMRLVAGRRFAYAQVALFQFVYLVLFSYTFFFEGFTGLAITLLCVLTLFVVMQRTARVDWDSLFRDRPSPSTPPPLPSSPDHPA